MSDKTIVPCPACQEAGSDKSGNHLAVYSNGKFGCALHPRDKDHNRRILELMPELGIGRRVHATGSETPQPPAANPIKWATAVSSFQHEQVHALRRWRGLSYDFVCWLKDRALVGYFSKLEHGGQSYTNRLAFPLHDDRGEVVGVHHVFIGGKDFLTVGRTQPWLIGPRDAKTWLIFESQWDAFAVLDQLEFHRWQAPYSILITRGAGNGKFASIIPPDAEATVVMQNDEASNGKNPAETWLEAIIENCPARLEVARPPSKVKDCNDWLRTGEADFHGMLDEAKPCGLRAVSLGEISCNVENDPGELLRHRFLCRGGAATLIGPTGIGKSSFLMQAAVLWSLGKPCFGIWPAKPLVSVIVQAENDDGDLVEMRDGVYRGLNLTDEEIASANARVFIHSENSKTGERLTNGVLRRLLRVHLADLLWLDNLFAYAGCNVSDQEKISAFLRTMLNPLITEFQCGLIVAHHTNKPPSGEQKAEWSVSEMAYLGSGTGELANWPRASLALRALKTPGIFELVAAKRGLRLGWKDDNGLRTCKKLIAHSDDGLIYWREASAHEIVVEVKQPEPTKSDVQNLMTIGEVIAKKVLVSRATGKKISERKAGLFIAELTADGVLRAIERPRSGTNREPCLERVQ